MKKLYVLIIAVSFAATYNSQDTFSIIALDTITGENCDDYKDHMIGPNYAIQGNILQGQHIFDSMETRFLNTGGMLAEKLMAVLQGANIPGADTRCTAEGVSSLSAFVRVAKPADTTGSYFCVLLMPETPYGVEPIDLLQVLFDEWMIYLGMENMPGKNNWLKIAPNPVAANEVLTISTPGNNKFKKIMRKLRTPDSS